MLIYQAGVAASFHSCPAFMSRVVRVLGTSGGACVSVMLLASPDKIEQALEHYCDGALFRGATFADMLDPTVRLLPRFVNELGLLSPGAHRVLSGADGRPRFSVHVTPLRLPFTNVAISDFCDEGEVLDAVRASCCLSPRGVLLRGERCADGGLSDSMPLCEETGVDTVTISPWHGTGIDVSPGLADAGVLVAEPRADLQQERLLEKRNSPKRLGAWIRYNPTWSNAKSLVDAAVPQGRQSAEQRFELGRRDGMAFLRSIGYGRA
ncbi:hypothetical protein T492DRAFT_991112 [Pavlovales sp. CCMP2436]|nr:hypothetical protein T492DRAFT_991112 [Pavlovales sp. CCMP2436]